MNSVARGCAPPQTETPGPLGGGAGREGNERAPIVTEVTAASTRPGAAPVRGGEQMHAPACAHGQHVLLRLETGAGGTQFRRYCLTCWRAGPAIAHAQISRPDDVPLADAELIELARQAWYRQQGYALSDDLRGLKD